MRAGPIAAWWNAVKAIFERLHSTVCSEPPRGCFRGGSGKNDVILAASSGVVQTNAKAAPPSTIYYPLRTDASQSEQTVRAGSQSQGWSVYIPQTNPRALLDMQVRMKEAHESVRRKEMK
mmetsp:Transcript_20133/g.55999  ORF Transcript_20133/g.55999 Transcript_20133/m.55999 type:complete len:120 (-) Transcript_20133:295-654(-)